MKRWDEQADGQLSETAMRTKLESLGYDVCCYDYPPGTVFPDHKHAVDKIDAVLAGEFQICMQGKTYILTAGDSIVVPHGVMHSARVLGDVSVISLDAIKADSGNH